MTMPDMKKPMTDNDKAATVSVILIGAAKLGDATIAVPVTSFPGPPPKSIADMVVVKHCDECHAPVYVAGGLNAKRFICMDCANEKVKAGAATHIEAPDEPTNKLLHLLAAAVNMDNDK